MHDTLGVSYRTFWHAPSEVLQETELVRVQRVRGYHRPVIGPGIGRDYLSSTFYLTEFRDQPVVLVDWVLGNDYLGADDPRGSQDPNLFPLGAVDVEYAAFLARDADLVLPYRPLEENILPPTARAGGYTAFEVLQRTYLGDGQTRRYRFLMLADDPAASPVEQLAARATAREMVADPMMPLASLESWQATHALGLFGGPVTGPTNAAQRAEEEHIMWLAENHFGSWGSRGDVKDVVPTGASPNQPLTQDLAHAVQSGDQRLLVMVEQKAWIQAARPYHLYGLRVEDADDILLWDGIPLYLGSLDRSRESLGRRALFAHDPYVSYRFRVMPGATNRAHGWEHFDPRQWSTDLLFDYWTVSGDAWAQEELRQLGETLRGIMRPSGYMTSELQSAQCEGWAMHGLVQAFQATGDMRFRDFALNRLHAVVDPSQPQHASGALTFTGTSSSTGFPTPHEFYMPWQHGAVMYGYLAAWKFFGEERLLQACEDASRSVEYGWVTGYEDPLLGLIPNGIRFYVPVGYNGDPVLADAFDSQVGVIWGGPPLGGRNRMLLGGLMLLADTTGVAAVRQRTIVYGTLLESPPYSEDELWSRWHYVVPEHWVR